MRNFNNIDLTNNSIENGGFEVVTSLPTNNNFDGRQVAYQGRCYIWNGSKWESNRNWLNVVINPTTPYMYAKLFTISKPYQNIELNLRPHIYALGNSSSVNYLISIAYNRVVINKLCSNPMVNGGTYHYNLHIKKVTPVVFEIYVGLPIAISYTDGLYADITNVGSILPTVELFTTLDTSDTNIWANLLYDENYFTEFHSLKTNKLKVNGASISNETINCDENTIAPTQTGTVTKTSTWWWQYLIQCVHFLYAAIRYLANGYIPRWNSTTQRFVNSKIYDDGTNVGIGTTSPTEALDVVGSIKSSAFIKRGASGNDILLGDGSVADKRSFLQKSGDVMTGGLTVNGNLTASGFIIPNGTSTQLLTADGNVIDKTSIQNYTLPTATSSILGGVKIGSGVTISSGVISVTQGSIGLGNVNNTADANKSVNYATSAGNADTVDGVHIDGIFTNLGVSGNSITATIGGVTKSITPPSVSFIPNILTTTYNISNLATAINTAIKPNDTSNVYSVVQIPISADTVGIYDLNLINISAAPIGTPIIVILQLVGSNDAALSITTVQNGTQTITYKHNLTHMSSDHGYLKFSFIKTSSNNIHLLSAFIYDSD